MARMKRYKTETEIYNNFVVDFIDSYTMGDSMEQINLCFCDCLEQLAYMRKLDLISLECFDEHFIDLLHFYKIALADSEE